MFSDEWDEATPTSLGEEETEVRGRSGSNSSEKMGRFEVRNIQCVTMDTLIMPRAYMYLPTIPVRPGKWSLLLYSRYPGQGVYNFEVGHLQ